MNTFEATRITMDWVMKRLEKQDTCHREDCPDRKDELCPFGEEFPKCPYGRDWDK